ncbi:MAG: hypothetical protein K6B68_10205 [Eubacterium sp.]|nr:hypothetical protein [Eubacterium sp.]
MKRKIWIRIVSLLLVLVMVAPFTVIDSNAASQTSKSSSKITQRSGVTLYEADEIESPKYEVTFDANKKNGGNTDSIEGSVAKNTARNTVKQRDWYSFGAKYAYNRLPAKQKKIYQEMYSYCMYILTTTDTYADIETNYRISRFVVNGYEYFKYLSKPFECGKNGISKQNAMNIFLVFLYENPQFYFIDATCVYLNGKFYIGFYEKFKNSQVRARTTNAIFDKVNRLSKKILAMPTEAQKARKAEEIVMEMNKYCASKSIPNAHYDEDYDQSIYSSFMMGYSICAGYAKAVQVLLRKSGMKAMIVTSSDHGWNLVNIDGHWYNLDATWDDNDNGGAFRTDYYLKSDDTVLRLDYAHHVREDVWGRAPKCFVDYGQKWPSQDADSNKAADYVDKISPKIKKNQLSKVYTPALVKVKPKIVISKKSYKYTGKPVKPKVTVKVNGHKLLASEYTVKYSKGCKARGKYKIFVSLKKSSGYKGSNSITYKVK